jgi:hypothetical protein
MINAIPPYSAAVPVANPLKVATVAINLDPVASAREKEMKYTTSRIKTIRTEALNWDALASRMQVKAPQRKK